MFQTKFSVKSNDYTHGLTLHHLFSECNKNIDFFSVAFSNRVCKISNAQTASRGCGFREGCKTVGLCEDICGVHMFYPVL